jgi:hypothetical protein
MGRSRYYFTNQIFVIMALSDILMNKLVWQRHLAGHKFGPVQTVIMSSEEHSCDLYPYGAIIDIMEDENGARWLTDRIDAISPDYPTRPIDASGIAIKRCSSCRHRFNALHAFDYFGRCTRCHHRNKIITDRTLKGKVEFPSSLKGRIEGNGRIHPYQAALLSNLPKSLLLDKGLGKNKKRSI